MTRFGRTALGAGAILALAIVAGCHREHRAAHPDRSAPATSSNDTAAASSQPSDATDTGDAKTFLDGLYARDKSGLQLFGADEAAVFDTKTLSLLRKDKQLLGGQASALKGDWLCDCANPGDAQATVTVQSANAAVGVANVAIQGGGAQQGSGQIGLDLTKLRGEWRIHDIRLSQGRRLRKVLIQEVKRLKGGGASATTSEAGE